LADLVDLAAQVAAFVRRHAADAAIEFRIAAGFLHGAALFFGARFVAARIELAIVGGALFGALTALLVLRLLAARAVPAIGMRQYGAAGQHGSRNDSNAKRCASYRGYFFVIDEHGVPKS
jgi:hypothetical protein